MKLLIGPLICKVYLKNNKYYYHIWLYKRIIFGINNNIGKCLIRMAKDAFPINSHILTALNDTINE